MTASKSTISIVLLICVAALSFALIPMSSALKTVRISATVPETVDIPDLPPTFDTDIDSILKAVVIDPTYSHAIEEHPIDAPIVRECFAQKGAYMQFQVEKNKRYLRVCIIDEKEGIVGFQIVDIVGRVAKERTAYIKETIRNIRQLMEYANRMGYPRFKGPL